MLRLTNHPNRHYIELDVFLTGVILFTDAEDFSNFLLKYTDTVVSVKDVSLYSLPKSINGIDITLTYISIPYFKGESIPDNETNLSFGLSYELNRSVNILVDKKIDMLERNLALKRETAIEASSYLQSELINLIMNFLL